MFNRSVCFLGLVCLVLYAWLGMRNFDLQMANCPQDDGPIFYSLAFEDPTLYEGSFQLNNFPISQIVPLKVYTSSVIWLPVVLWHYWKVDPYWTTWWVTLIQGLMLAVAIYSLTLTFVNDRLIAILAVVFACVAVPWGWDPANYGVRDPWNFRLYPGLFVLIPILFSVRALIRGSFRQAFLLLALAGIIHPGLALQAITLAGFYWAWNFNRANIFQNCKFGIAPIVLVAITVFPALVATGTMDGTQLPTNELMEGMRENQHLWPWGHEGRWAFSVPTTVEWLVLTLLSLRLWPLFSRRVQRVWLAGILTVSLFSLSQLLGGLLDWPWLLSLMGLRSWSWFSLISLPMVIVYWTHLLKEGRWTGSMCVLLSLLLPFYPQEYGVFCVPIGALVLMELGHGQFSRWKFELPSSVGTLCQALAIGLLVGWGIILLVLPLDKASIESAWLKIAYNWSWDVDGALPTRPQRAAVLFVVCGVSLLWAWCRTRVPAQTLSGKYLFRNLLLLVVVFYAGWYLNSEWESSQAQRRSSDVLRLEAQLWVRKHTPKSAGLIIPGSYGWRTMARRRVLDPFTHENYAYVATVEAKQHRNNLLNFYGISEDAGRRLRGKRITQIEMDRFWKFRKKEFMLFASEFGATHLVLPTQYRFTEVTDLQLPLLYRNDYFVIYLLNQEDSQET